MCGIVGIFDMRGKQTIDRALLSRMNESQYHRGPNEGGLHCEPGLGFGHRRLSIIDVSSGQQPLFNKDKTVVVTFNGEIYNFLDVRRDLEHLGYEFQTRCDTEVIVYAWQAWGESCVERFRGMFAFAVWDRNQEILFLARDRLGVKPLYFAEAAGGQFLFSSELKALLIHPGLQRKIDPTAVEDYFAYGYVPDPKTIFHKVYKLSPGHHLTIQRRQPYYPKRYWCVPFVEQPSVGERDAEAELIERLREAVRIRLMAEVPLGAFLSGGVDSSAIVAMMAGLSVEPVNTCSISFGDPEYNETQYAQRIADRYRTSHRTEKVDPDDFSLVDRLTELYDEPYADSSALPTYRVCELAKKQVTVVLSGDGGDENFAGYRRYRWHTYEERMRSLLPATLRSPLFGFLGNVYPKADWAPKVFRAKSTFEAMARNTVEGYFYSVSVMSDSVRAAVFSQKLKDELQGYSAVNVLRDHADRAPSCHPLSLVQYLDLTTYLPGDILTKVDRASMAHALEVRVPLLDHKLVEWVSGLPPEFKLRGREGKYLFKKALEPYVPGEILYRPKMGFAVPLANWFRGPLRNRVREAVLSPCMTESGYFDNAFLRKMLDQHQSGIKDYSASLWSLLMYDSFLRRYT
jgi:asparagine synthase (glutamine-hydrolysing)